MSTPHKRQRRQQKQNRRASRNRLMHLDIPPDACLKGVSFDAADYAMWRGWSEDSRQNQPTLPQNRRPT